MRIGLLYPERVPLDPQSWSGTPAGLANGFEELGHEVVPVGVRLPWVVQTALSAMTRLSGQRGAVYDRMWPRQFGRNVALTGEMKRVGTVDLLICMGSEMYALSKLQGSAAVVVTYDDATLAQMWRHPDSDLRLSGFSESRVQTWIRRQCASSRAADLNLVSTSWAAASFVDDYGIEPARVKSVGMGHRPRRVDATMRDWSVPRYLYLGVDWERKNGAAVVDAFKRVRRDYPEAQLDMVGNTPVLHEPGVTTHGLLRRGDSTAQKIIVGLLARATCFAMPSRLDPSPIAYLEAGSSGIPVVGTREGGAMELLGGGSIAVDPHDTEAIAVAMKEFADPVRARQCGEIARRAAALTTWSGVAQKILNAASMVPPWSGRHNASQVQR